MELSKAFECLPYDLLIAKLEAYDFDSIGLKLFLRYFSKWKLSVKISYKRMIDILPRISQGSFLGPLILDIFINDLIMFVEKKKNTLTWR